MPQSFVFLQGRKNSERNKHPHIQGLHLSAEQFLLDFAGDQQEPWSADLSGCRQDQQRHICLFWAYPPLKLDIWCWKIPQDTASLSSIVGQHCLFLVQEMQWGPPSNRLLRSSKEAGNSQRFVLLPSQNLLFRLQLGSQPWPAQLPSLTQWECLLPGRGGNSLNFNHILAASSKARKILVYMIRNKMCYMHIFSSAISVWAQANNNLLAKCNANPSAMTFWHDFTSRTLMLLDLPLTDTQQNYCYCKWMVPDSISCSEQEK